MFIVGLLCYDGGNGESLYPMLAVQAETDDEALKVAKTWCKSQIEAGNLLGMKTFQQALEGTGSFGRATAQEVPVVMAS